MSTEELAIYKALFTILILFIGSIYFSIFIIKIKESKPFRGGLCLALSIGSFITFCQLAF